MKIIKRDNGKRSYPSTYTPVRSIFDDFFTPSLWEDDFFTTQPGFSNLSADVWEEDEDIFVKMALPGIKKDDIKITINEDNISIRGEVKEEEKEDKEKKYYFKSMETAFEQSFNLPTKVNPENVEAEFKDGVLKVKLPKAEQVKPRKVEIK